MCLKGIVYHEARGEPSLGQAAVAAVVLNRSEQTGDEVCRTIRKRGQFTGKRPLRSSPKFSVPLDLVDKLPSGIRDATYFRNYPGKWSNHKYVGQIGHHYFYKD